MNVSAVLVTRGDVDLTPITDSLTAAGIDDIVVWNNAEREDLAVYGRYAAIAEAKHEFIYTQDDDCVLRPEWIQILGRIMSAKWDEPGPEREVLVANMPQPFRHEFYSDHCLVGFGAVFHRDLPARAVERLFPDMLNPDPLDPDEGGWWDYKLTIRGTSVVIPSPSFFRRTCDVVFTALTPRVLLDLPYENLPWASDASRMWKQNGHVAERTRMLDLVRKVRDA